MNWQFISLLLVLVGTSFQASADEHYCTYFGGVTDGASLEELSLYQLEKHGCVKGDALHLIVYDRSKSASGREGMYLADEITQLCDLDRPVTVVGQVAAGSGEKGAYHAVCTYAGERRRPRSGTKGQR